MSRFATESKNQFYFALIYSLSLLVAWDSSVEASHAMRREVFICASVVSSELTWVHHCKIESFKVNFNFKRFKVNVCFLREKVQS